MREVSGCGKSIQVSGLLVFNGKQIRETPTKRDRKGAKSGEHSVGRYETGKDRYIEGKTFTNGLSSQGRRTLWSRDMGVEEERGNRKVAG